MNEKDFESLFPGFADISDGNLRQSAIATWVAATKEGDWARPEFVLLPFVMAELVDCPVTLVEHVNAVTATAKSIYQQLTDAYGQLLTADRDVVIAGALLHDVGKVIEYKKDGRSYTYSEKSKLLRHPLAGTLAAARCGVPDRVLHIIATHSFEGGNSHMTLESFIVRNADWINFNFLSLKYPSTMTHK